MSSSHPLEVKKWDAGKTAQLLAIICSHYQYKHTFFPTAESPVIKTPPHAVHRAVFIKLFKHDEMMVTAEEAGLVHQDEDGEWRPADAWTKETFNPVVHRVDQLKYAFTSGCFRKECHIQGSWKSFVDVPKEKHRESIRRQHPYYFTLRNLMVNDKVASRARSDSPELEARTDKRRVVSTPAVATRESLAKAAFTSKVQKRRESSAASLSTSVAAGLRPSPTALGPKRPRASLPTRTSTPVAAISRSSTLSTHSASVVSSRLSVSRVSRPVSPSVISISSDSSSSRSPSPPPSPPPSSRRRRLPPRRIPSLSPSTSSTSPSPSPPPSAARPKRLFGQLRPLPLPPSSAKSTATPPTRKTRTPSPPRNDLQSAKPSARCSGMTPWAPADALVGMGVGAAMLAWSDDGMEWEDAGQRGWGMHQAGEEVVLEERGGRLQDEWVEVRAAVESGSEDESEDGMLHGFEEPGIEDVDEEPGMEDVDEEEWNELEFLRFEAAEQEADGDEEEEEEAVDLAKDVGGLGLKRRPARRSILSHLLSQEKEEAISQEKETIYIDSDSD